MPKKYHKEEPDRLEQELAEWMFSEPTPDSAFDFLHGFNLYVNSAIELTRLIVEAEKATKPLDRYAILDIYNLSIENIGKSIMTLSKDI